MRSFKCVGWRPRPVPLQRSVRSAQIQMWCLGFLSVSACSRVLRGVLGRDWADLACSFATKEIQMRLGRAHNTVVPSSGKVSHSSEKSMPASIRADASMIVFRQSRAQSPEEFAS